MQKGLAPILIIILLAALVGGYFIWSSYSNNRTKPVTQNSTVTYQTPQPTLPSSPSPSDETANWKVYVNTKLGFQVKYPPDYSAPVLPTGPVGPNPVATDQETDAALIFCKTPSSCFELRIFPFPGTLDDVLDSSNAQGIPPYKWKSTDTVKASLVKDLQVGDVKARWLKADYINSASPQDYEAIFFVNKGSGYIFNTFSTVDINTFNQILSTFKFTE